MPIPVALMTTELTVGGAERCLTHLAIGLDRRRFAPQVYSLAPPPTERTELVDRLRGADVPIHFCGVQSNAQFFAALARTAQAMRRQRPELVQTFLFHANTIGMLAARRVGVKRRVMGVRVADPTRWRSRIERRLARRADRVVCVSRSVEHHCQARGFPAEKLTVIPNGIEMNEFDKVQPADLSAIGVPPGRAVVAVVGRLDRQKGLDWFVGLLPQFFARAERAHVVLVGDGPERSEIERRLFQLRIADRVTLAGWRPDVPAILAASRCLALPSRWEGMPNVVAEAMATGLPIAATRADGVLELLGPLGASQTADFGDGERFINLLHEASSGDDTARRHGDENRRRIATEFSIQGMVERYSDLYTALLENGSEG